MKLLSTLIFMSFLFAAPLLGQDLMVGTTANDTIINVTNTSVFVSFGGVRVKSVTVINYDADDNVYITWDTATPDVTGAAGTNAYILPPNFERTWWCQAGGVTLRCAAAAAALVGVEWWR